ncbi:MAG: SAM-dependent methyltransferase [Bacteroidota bacterium]
MGVVYLIPVTLGNSAPEDVIPNYALQVTRNLDFFMVENAKSARAFLKSINSVYAMSEIEVIQIDKHGDNKLQIADALKIVSSGKNLGIMSESGMPSIADPGSEVVRMAHQLDIDVIPLVGPSSILLALSASGLNGQGFSFHGYLPKDKEEKRSKIKELEMTIKKTGYTQIFIETPYRNEGIWLELLAQLSGETRICIASGITTSDQFIKTLKVLEWRQKTPPKIKDIPTVFLLGR